MSERIQYNFYQDRSIALIGAGVSGISACALSLHLGARTVLVNQGNVKDWRPFEHPNLTCLSEQQFFDSANQDSKQLWNGLDLVIWAPGIDPRKELFSDFLQSISQARPAVKVISEIEFGGLFLQDEKVIAITGTNGKTTTVTMAQEALRFFGARSRALGNIGTPLCDYVLEVLKNQQQKVDYLLLELSSFQLEKTFELMLDQAYILNFSSSHLERYNSSKEYFLAKKRIFDLPQRSTPCYGIGQDIAAWSEQQKKEYQLDQYPGLQVIEQNFPFELSLLGHHNRANAQVVLMILKNLWSDKWVADHQEKLQEFFINFKGPEHRTEVVFNGDDMMIVNDSKSTNWQSTLSALDALEEDQVIYLIVGGAKRSNELDHYDLLAIEKIMQKVGHLYVMGEVAEKLEKLLSSQSFENFSLEAQLDDCLKDFFHHSHQKKKVLLFSPAYPSFDAYKNYKERGEDFKKKVLSFLN